MEKMGYSYRVSPDQNTIEFSFPGKFNASVRRDDDESSFPVFSCDGKGTFCVDAQNLFFQLINVDDKTHDGDNKGNFAFPTGPFLGLIVICASAAAILGLLFVYKFIYANKRDDENRSVSSDGSGTDSDGDVDVLLLQESIEAPLLSNPNPFRSDTMSNISGNDSISGQTTISNSRLVPVIAKIVIPIMIFCTMGLFLSANTTVGAAVNFDASVFGFSLGPFDIFNFSLVNTITDMYKAKVYILAGLVAVWSGAWPYLKLLLLLICWYIPPTYLSSKRRGHLLIFLDAFGKWCMLDAFLMCMMSVAFRFNIVVFSEQIIAVNVNVDEAYGVFVFVIATILSLVLSHAVLAYHRNSSSSRRYKLFANEALYRQFRVPCPKGSWFDVGSMKVNKVADNKERLLKYVEASACMHFQGSFFLINALVFTTLIACFLLIWFGAFTYAFSFTFTGIAGKLIKIVEPDEIERKHSLLSIATSLGEGDATDSEYIGIVFLQAVYLIFALVMPLILVIFLFALWFIPMSLRDQKIVFYVTEVVSAWNAIDVFIISILSSVVEINQFAQFLIGDRCDIVEKILKQKCFGVDTNFLPGVWLIFAAAFMLFFSSRIISWMAEKALEKRETSALSASAS